MNYQERVELIAGIWSYTFTHSSMTKEDHEAFRESCKDAEVDTLDVLGCITERGI